MILFDPENNTVQKKKRHKKSRPVSRVLEQAPAAAVFEPAAALVFFPRLECMAQVPRNHQPAGVECAEPDAEQAACAAARRRDRTLLSLKFRRRQKRSYAVHARAKQHVCPAHAPPTSHQLKYSLQSFFVSPFSIQERHLSIIKKFHTKWSLDGV